MYCATKFQATALQLCNENDDVSIDEEEAEESRKSEKAREQAISVAFKKQEKVSFCLCFNNMSAKNKVKFQKDSPPS